MARLTRDEVVTEGMLLAGRDPTDTADFALAVGWLQRWLDSVAASWPWPINRRPVVVVVPAGSATAQFGTGSSGSPGTPQVVLEIMDAIWLYKPDNTALRRLPIRSQLAAPYGVVGPGATHSGAPSSVQLLKNADATWTILLDQLTDQAYNLWLTCVLLPEVLGPTGKPWYQSDETLVQAVGFKCNEYWNGPDAKVTESNRQLLSTKVVEDRMRYGVAPGINRQFSLNPEFYPKARW